MTFIKIMNLTIVASPRVKMIPTRNNNSMKKSKIPLIYVHLLLLYLFHYYYKIINLDVPVDISLVFMLLPANLDAVISSLTNSSMPFSSHCF